MREGIRRGGAGRGERPIGPPSNMRLQRSRFAAVARHALITSNGAVPVYPDMGGAARFGRVRSWSSAVRTARLDDRSREKFVRSRVQTITPARAAEWLEANTTNRPLSRAVVRLFAEAMRRGEWLVTHQGIAFDVNGVLVDGQHRLAAIIEADRPVELTVFSEVAEGTFDVLDTGKRRTAADVLAIEGEKNSTMLAAM